MNRIVPILCAFCSAKNVCLLISFLLVVAKFCNVIFTLIWLYRSDFISNSQCFLWQSSMWVFLTITPKCWYHLKNSVFNCSWTKFIEIILNVCLFPKQIFRLTILRFSSRIFFDFSSDFLMLFAHYFSPIKKIDLY